MTVNTTWFETKLVTGTSSFIGSNDMRAPYTCGLLMNTFSVPCSSVYPSGDDFATRSLARLPPVPGLFSITTGWPRRTDSP